MLMPKGELGPGSGHPVNEASLSSGRNFQHAQAVPSPPEETQSRRQIERMLERLPGQTPSCENIIEPSPWDTLRKGDATQSNDSLLLDTNGATISGQPSDNPALCNTMAESAVSQLDITEAGKSGHFPQERPRNHSGTDSETWADRAVTSRPFIQKEPARNETPLLFPMIPDLHYLGNLQKAFQSGGNTTDTVSGRYVQPVLYVPGAPNLSSIEWETLNLLHLKPDVSGYVPTPIDDERRKVIPVSEDGVKTASHVKVEPTENETKGTVASAVGYQETREI